MEWVSEYESWMRASNAAPRTVEARTRFAERVLAVWDLQEVTPSMIRSWLGNPSYSQWTRATYYSHFRSLFGWLHEEGLIEVDPTATVKRPRPPRCVPRPLSSDEATLVLTSVTGDVRTWVLLAMLAGLRANEIATLRGEHVTAEVIYVVGKGAQAAFIPTHPLLWELAQDYPRNGWWFPMPGGHVARSTVSAKVSRLFDRLGIEGSIHRSRHSFATNLLRTGTNIRVVQTLMRHADLSTTAAYCAVDENERAAAIALLGAA